MHCPLVAKTNARWSIVDCRLVACAKAADFDERAKSNQSGHRNLNRAPEGEHFIKKSKRDRQAKTGEDSPLGGAWIQRLHYIPTNNHIFSFLVKSNLVKLETSCTVILPLGECSLAKTFETFNDETINSRKRKTGYRLLLSGNDAN